MHPYLESLVFPLANRFGGFAGGGVVRGLPIPTVLTSGSSTTDGTSVATASIAPVAHQPIYAAVVSQSASGVTPPTSSGNDLTWVSVKTGAIGTDRLLAVFRTAGAAPSAGAVTFDFSGDTQTSFAWIVVQFADADISGTGGSGATLQAPDATTGAAVTSLAAPTLSAFEHVNNVNLSFFGLSINQDVTSDADFTELADVGAAAATVRCQAEWARNQTGCTATFDAANAAAVSIEVKAA